MLLPIPEEILQAQARERTIDAVLSSLGLSAAAVSASFAAYMIVVGPGTGTGLRTAPIFALAGTRSHAPRAAAAPPHGSIDAAPPEPEDIDFDPTGSIAALPGEAKPDPDQAARTVLNDFAVRDAFDGTALVEAHGTLQMAQPGTMLDGAGRVLSVTHRRDGWVVATSGGLILQRR